MASRDSFGNGGAQGTSPSDRAIAAYEERFFNTANSNDSKRRMLEERMTRPTPGPGITAGDALNMSNAGVNDQPDSDDDEQNAFRVEPKRARRGGGSGHTGNNGAPARGVATSPLGDKERATPGSAGGRAAVLLLARLAVPKACSLRSGRPRTADLETSWPELGAALRSRGSRGRRGLRSGC